MRTLSFDLRGFEGPENFRPEAQTRGAGASCLIHGALVSALVLVTFAVVMALALTRSLPAGSETILSLLLGSLAAMATSVVSYWVGSSAGSARKDDHLAKLASGQSG